MDNIPLDSPNSALKENQIVSLDYLDHHLYGEVIQLIRDRRLCWFRPLCLSLAKLAEQDIDLSLCLKQERGSNSQRSTTSAPNEDFASTHNPKLIDLQSGSDLLLPDILFRPALDLEIIDFLPQLSDISHNSAQSKIDRKCLNKFVYLVWQAHQDKF